MHEEHNAPAPSEQAGHQPRLDLPSVDRLLGLPSVQGLASRYGRSSVVKAVRALIAAARATAREGTGGTADWNDASVGAVLARQL
mgnify:FL=1